MLESAVAFARASGAAALEGWPISNSYKRRGGESFESREHVFEKCGFTCIRRPSPRRSIMRIDFTE